MEVSLKASGFTSDSGKYIVAITTEQMREVDRVAMEITGPNIFQMMENAGRNLASLTIEKLGGGWRDARILILAGTGGNGGGGICAARHLANRGANVRICLSDEAGLGEVPSFQRRIFGYAGGIEISIEALEAEKPDLIVDALIGYSLQSAPAGNVRKMIGWANLQNAPKLSLDVPSGVDATTGETPGEYIKADWTMTLALPKTGLLPALTGELYLSDIGIPAETYRSLDIPYQPSFDERYCVAIGIRNGK